VQREPRPPPKRNVSRRVALGWLGLALCPLAAAIARLPGEVAAELPGAQLAGSGRLSYFGLRIYESRLWVSEGFRADAFEKHPFAIEIEYLRAFSGRQIAERSLTEMQRIGSLPLEQRSTWLAALQRMIPDVAQGDRLTGVHRPGEALRLFLNGKPLGEWLDAGFAQAFFGIWLSPRTSEPRLRLAMLGSAS